MYYEPFFGDRVITFNGGQPKFEKDELHRRPEFEDKKPDVSNLPHASGAGSSIAAGPSKPTVKAEPVGQAMPPPLTGCGELSDLSSRFSHLL